MKDSQGPESEFHLQVLMILLCSHQAWGQDYNNYYRDSCIYYCTGERQEVGVLVTLHNSTYVKCPKEVNQ